jgi:hypothetical protein
LQGWKLNRAETRMSSGISRAQAIPVEKENGAEIIHAIPK